MGCLLRSRSYCVYAVTMSPKSPSPVALALAAVEDALRHVDPDRPSAALPHLRAAQDHLTRAIDEAMATAVLAEGSTIRTAGSLAGLSENAVGPRLARTSLLSAYAGPDSGRVTASGVERARYDLEEGRHRRTDPGADPSRPMRFRARRPT
ncbi:hypothetical protein Intca_0088 [Intrasporangium calvum DSM 43043]|uniref:Uncharacterized protein n=2 Tax=Intrasporangium calvum TaxID=53358 RepID=E6SEP9_INTC7|nr:hypothetical protein Intca_0088 [Intrasporangium calvum DSM 43043]